MSLTIALLFQTQLSFLCVLGTALLVKVPAITEAVLGDVAQLNCTYPPGEGLILYWSRLGPGSEKNVFTYSRGKGLTQHNDPAYQGRATVPDGQPEHGNGALWLHNLTLADEGKYRCRVKSDTGMGVAEMELQLRGDYHLSWLQHRPCSPSLQNVTLQCLAKDGYPMAVITIHDSTGRDYGVGPPAARNPQGLYNATHTAIVPCSSNATYICIINTTAHQQNNTWGLILEENMVGLQPVWHGWPAVGLGIGLTAVMLVSGALLAWQLRKTGQSPEGLYTPQKADVAREEETLLYTTTPTGMGTPTHLHGPPPGNNLSSHTAPGGSLSPMVQAL